MKASAAEVLQKEKTVCLKNILLATDFSSVSEKATGYAIGIARRHGSQLHVVHVVPRLSEHRQDENSTRQMDVLSDRSELKEISHQLTLRRGPVCSVLSDAIRRENIDLLVVGTHGRGGMKKLALGSVAEEMVRLASCPVVTVGPGTAEAFPEGGQFRPIVFATDFGAASVNALQYAVPFAKQSRAKLILLHVMPSAPLVSSEAAWSLSDAQSVMEWRARQMSVTEKKLAKLLPSDTEAGYRVEYVVIFDLLFEGILRVVAERHADLIVMGANPTLGRKVFAHIPGTVVHQIMCHAACPVLTVRT
jgi:nucleotide-binding universal stress UspA family protein